MMMTRCVDSIASGGIGYDICIESTVSLTHHTSYYSRIQQYRSFLVILCRIVLDTTVL